MPLKGISSGSFLSYENREIFHVEPEIREESHNDSRLRCGYIIRCSDFLNASNPICINDKKHG